MKTAFFVTIDILLKIVGYGTIATVIGYSFYTWPALIIVTLLAISVGYVVANWVDCISKN